MQICEPLHPRLTQMYLWKVKIHAPTGPREYQPNTLFSDVHHSKQEAAKHVLKELGALPTEDLRGALAAAPAPVSASASGGAGISQFW